MIRFWTIVTAFILSVVALLSVDVKAAPLDFGSEPSVSEGLDIEQGTEQPYVDNLEADSVPPPIYDEGPVTYSLGMSGHEVGGNNFGSNDLTELEVLIQIRDILSIFYAFLIFGAAFLVVRFTIRKGLGVFVRFTNL